MKKFFRCLHPVIHRHHLMALDHQLSIIHQEDHQSRKIKMSHQGNLAHSVPSPDILETCFPSK